MVTHMTCLLVFVTRTYNCFFVLLLLPIASSVVVAALDPCIANKMEWTLDAILRVWKKIVMDY